MNGGKRVIKSCFAAASFVKRKILSVAFDGIRADGVCRKLYLARYRIMENFISGFPVNVISLYDDADENGFT